MEQSQAFQDIVAQFDAFADDVDLAYQPKEIGSGEFTVLFEKLRTTDSVKDGVTSAVVRANFQILEGEREGDSFADQFYLSPNPDDVGFAQRRLLLLARTASGRTIKTIKEALEALNDAVGEATLLVSIEPSTSKKNNTTYYNVIYRGTPDA